MNTKIEDRKTDQRSGGYHFLLEMVSWKWHRYSPDGSKKSWQHYAKLCYGLLGLSMLVYMALSYQVSTNRYIEEERARRELAGQEISPSVWYWRWVIPAAEADVVAFDDGGFDDEDEFEFGEEPEIVAVDNTLFASWGTDHFNHSIRKWMGEGAVNYLIYGLMASLISILGGLLWATIIEWRTRPRLPYPHRNSFWRRQIQTNGRAFLEMIDNVPKLLLLLGIFVIGGVTGFKLAIAMGVFLTFGTALLFQDRFTSIFASEQYLYALEIGLHPMRIYLVHIIKRQVLPLFLVQIPFLLSAFILYEATISYLGWSDPEISSWGVLIRENLAYDNWSYRIPMITLLFIVSSLYILGDALREWMVAEK